MEAVVPDKLFLKIGEVAKIVSLRPSVLRYWETEFQVLKPVKSRTGQRLYTKKEVTLIFEIKKLLYAEKHTIEGARKKITGRGKNQGTANGSVVLPPDNASAVLNDIRNDLLSIRKSL